MKTSSFMRLFSSKLYRFLFFVLAGLLFTGCRKEKFDIEGVTGYTWNVYTLQEANVGYMRPVPASWRLRLNSDQSFSLDLDGSSCKGTYSWTPVDASNARVTFTVKQWSGTNQPEVVKTILQGVNSCYLYRPPSLPSVLASFTTASMAMEFSGSAGYLGVYR
jgi:hypothetical protein